MKISKPFTGVLAFLIVLFTMPLGHAAMIVMEKTLGHGYIYQAAVLLGLLGLVLLVWGILSRDGTKATFLGLFAGLFIWTGWIEFAYVYYAHRFGVAPLIENGQVVTKPEYLIMPSSVGFWAVAMIFYFFGTKTGCLFFNWFQRRLSIRPVKELKPVKRSTALSVFMELILLLWTFYLVLLFAYDDRFFGDRSVVTYIIAFGSLLWSLYLFRNLLKIDNLSYAIRYAVPTVIIFWNFVEILGRWDVLKEIWIEPFRYRLEILLTAGVFVILLAISVIESRKKGSNKA